MKYLNLFSALTVKNLRVSTRYWMNTATSLVILLILFLVFFYLPQAVVGSPIKGERENTIIIGYIIWVLTLIGFQSLPDSIVEESRTGTLEQLYMSHFRIEIIFFFELIYSFLLALVYSGVILGLIMLITGKYFSFLELIQVIPVALLMLSGVWGIAFVLAGLAVVFKRLESLYNLVQFLLVGFVILGAIQSPVIYFMPISHATVMIHKLINEGYSLASFNSLDWIILCANSLCYFLLGIFIYKLCEKTAMKKALLGHY